jgi:hypothetical protein
VHESRRSIDDSFTARFSGTRVRDQRTNLITIGYVRPTARPVITVATKRSTPTLHRARCTDTFAQCVEGAWLPTSMSRPVQRQQVDGKRLCLIARATLKQDVFRTSVLNEKVEKYDTGNCEVV